MAVFGEILVDMVWSIDAELEEVQGDAKLAMTNEEQASQSGEQTTCSLKLKSQLCVKFWQSSRL